MVMASLLSLDLQCSEKKDFDLYLEILDLNFYIGRLNGIQGGIDDSRTAQRELPQLNSNKKYRYEKDFSINGIHHCSDRN